ncbi:DUF1007 family protein [Roseovarius gahaiensis]|uniref:DUF1007 family protein n=1 Tax=Roseovarius gahaiensis TaxID=2716691 RepID=A0A967BFI4_9RHOB|nr:DUF1007 family protein [Roseovarius gahaiensis]NHQ75968.1 DUF1007 family protein [Roseovarius gahaiensis]
MSRWIALCCMFLVTPAAWAHPHVFVDVSLRFLSNDEGLLTGVEVTWSYDEFFSLLVLEDRGLDPDADMVLTEAERAALLGFDLADWPDGFEGALFLFEGGQTVTLDPPKATYADLQEGRVVTRHTRRFAPVAADGLVGRPYDPAYYAALTLDEVSGLSDACAVAVERPDTAAADAIVAKLGNSADEGFFDEVQVGIHYADTFEVTCAASS